MAKWDVDKIANSIVFVLNGQTAGSSQPPQPPNQKRKVVEVVE